MYTIYRIFKNHNHKEVILSGLTLKEVQAHCANPETSSSTCTNHEGTTRTKLEGHWFDAYGED